MGFGQLSPELVYLHMHAAMRHACAHTGAVHALWSLHQRRRGQALQGAGSSSKGTHAVTDRRSYMHAAAKSSDG